MAIMVHTQLGTNKMKSRFPKYLKRQRLLIFLLTVPFVVTGTLLADWNLTTQFQASVVNSISKSDIASGQHVEVPMALNWCGHLTIEASYHGRPLRFVVDTGARCVCIDQQRTKDLPLAWTGTPTPSDDLIAFWGWQLDMRCAVTELTIGTYPICPFWANGFDATKMNEALVAKGDMPVDGIIGCDLLVLHGGIIDYAKRMLTLRPPGSSVSYLPPFEEGAMVTHQDKFFVQVLPDDWDRESKYAKRLSFFVSDDKGQTWKHVRDATPAEKGLWFVTKSNGVYWFAVQVEWNNGVITPPVSQLEKACSMNVILPPELIRTSASYLDILVENELLRKKKR